MFTQLGALAPSACDRAEHLRGAPAQNACCTGKAPCLRDTKGLLALAQQGSKRARNALDHVRLGGTQPGHGSQVPSEASTSTLAQQMSKQRKRSRSLVKAKGQSGVLGGSRAGSPGTGERTPVGRSAGKIYLKTLS